MVSLASPPSYLLKIVGNGGCHDADSHRIVTGSLFFYAPNKGAPVFFATAFFASGLCHIYQCM